MSTVNVGSGLWDRSVANELLTFQFVKAASMSIVAPVSSEQLATDNDGNIVAGTASTGFSRQAFDNYLSNTLNVSFASPSESYLSRLTTKQYSFVFQEGFFCNSGTLATNELRVRIPVGSGFPNISSNKYAVVGWSRVGRANFNSSCSVLVELSRDGIGNVNITITARPTIAGGFWFTMTNSTQTYQVTAQFMLFAA
jgi:hypothetical protein